MQEVTLYTVTKTKVMSYNGYEIGIMRNGIAHKQVTPLDNDKFLIEKESEVRVPIQKVVEYKEDDATIRQRQYPDYEPKYNEEYIAIEPNLEEIIAGKYKQQLSDLTEEIGFTRHFMKTYQNKVDNFNKLPWYKRLAAAVKGKI